jgi:hypothetical protein
MGRPKGPQVTVMTPGQHAKHSLAGARAVTTGPLWHCLGARKTNALFRALLALLEERSPAPAIGAWISSWIMAISIKPKP